MTLALCHLRLQGLRGSVSRRPSLLAVLALVVLAALAAPATTTAYSPHQGDFFAYHEVTTVNNGAGSYSGYSDQTVTNGAEQMTAVSGSTVSASYNFTYVYSNDEESNTTTVTKSGAYTFNATSLLYLNGTDDQTGYTNPTVWFAMNSTIPVGGRFSLLGTVFTVSARHSSYFDQGLDERIAVIYAEGSGSYQRDDSYGVFNASYTWDAYFDPVSGYIVGYHYVEQDKGSYEGQPGSFTYTDDLYVTSTSYPLTEASSGSSSAGYVVAIAGLALFALLLLAIVLYISRRRGKHERLQEHSPPPAAYSPPPYSPTGPSPGAAPPDLIPKDQPPVQQVVIREVAKVNCKFCGALIDSTADKCPHCGAPRT